MAEDGRRRVALFASSWGRPHDEPAFVARSIAGALSRAATVDVLVPGRLGPARPDGAFDLQPVGEPAGPDDPWPFPNGSTWRPAADYDAVVVDRPSPALRALVGRWWPDAPLATITPGPSGADEGVAGHLVVGVDGTLSRGADGCAHGVGLHVAVNPLAAAHRHGGLGFTDYVLVLSDRRPSPAPDDPPAPAAAWLAARFTRPVTVVVEDGVASVWSRRSLLGRIAVATRMDLWRLVSHAAVTVDLAPGPLVGRECVESLRFGVPIVVPAGTTGQRLAAAGGGLWYRDVAELLGCVEALLDRDVRSALGDQGHRLADRWYGNPDEFVERVASALSALVEGSPEVSGS